MKKKILIVICSIAILILTAVTPLAFTASYQLPTIRPLMPFQNLAIRGRDADNNPIWYNFVDSRVFRNPDDEYIYTYKNIDAQNSPSDLEITEHIRYEDSNTFYELNFPSQYVTHDSYVYINFGDFATSGREVLQTSSLIQLSRNYEWGKCMTRAEISYDRITVNNLTGKVTTIKEHDVAFPYTTTSGESYISIAPYGYGGAEIVRNFVVRVYYTGYFDNLILASSSEVITNGNAQNWLGAEGVYKTEGSFDPVTVPTDWFGWVVDGVNGFMQLQILPNVTLWVVFYGIVGVSLFIFIFKKFAGG